MHHARLRRMVLAVTLLPGFATHAFSQDSVSAEKTNAESEIKATVAEYVSAFNARDVEKLVAHWSPDGVYTNRADGEQVIGKEAIAEQFKEIFAAENAPKLEVATESIELISPNVALERGTAIVTFGEADPVQTSFSVVYVKQDGKWLIDRETEDLITIEHASKKRLSELEWLFGEWTCEADGVTIDLECHLTKNEHFISRTFRISHDGDVESSGLQIIGWDPVKEQISSWLFDSDGSVVTGTWTKRETKWVVQSVATLADGGKGSFTSILTPIDDASFGWQKTNAVLDGKLLPSVPESIFHRK